MNKKLKNIRSSALRCTRSATGKITGIGVDIESINRIKNSLSKFSKHRLKEIFTESELDYAFSKKDPWPHLAARFCAKEAVVKALGKPKGLTLGKIEIISGPKGRPEVKISPHFLRGRTVKISISHSSGFAIAAAACTEKN